VGKYIPNIWKNKSHVPNRQPVQDSTGAMSSNGLRRHRTAKDRNKSIPDAPCMEDLPTFPRTKLPSYVGKYISTMEHMGIWYA
jgi:hypothetical protein